MVINFEKRKRSSRWISRRRSSRSRRRRKRRRRRMRRSGLLVVGARPSNVGLFWRRVLFADEAIVLLFLPRRRGGKRRQLNRRPFRICADEQLRETVSQQHQHQTRPIWSMAAGSIGRHLSIAPRTIIVLSFLHSFFNSVFRFTRRSCYSAPSSPSPRRMTDEAIQ